MSSSYNVAVVGATGAVGEVMVEILEERGFPVEHLHLLASERSAGKRVSFRGKSHVVQNLENFDFSKANIALFSAGGGVSEVHAPRAAAAGCIVIDNTSHFRRDADIPLIVPEVNADAVEHSRGRGIIANPNCSTIQMLVALKPLHDLATLTRINVATYQAVSGTGKSAIEELATQTAKLLNGHPVESHVYPRQIAFNALPHIDTFQDNGYTREEMKMVWETQKIFADDSIRVNPTCVRVPVFHGHAEAIQIETRDELSVENARAALDAAAGVVLLDERRDGGYATQVSDAAGKDPVFVSRLRKDISCDRGLNLWVVADNLRKGAALNSVQIAELLHERGLAKAAS
ncbi:MAG: aspartate-semialdehyde dehydrogenase [Pseudomonadota bacterium]